MTWTISYLPYRPRCLEEHPLRVKHKQDWGRGFILLLPQDAVLTESDAGSHGDKASMEFRHLKPSDLELHVVPDVWGTLLERGLRFVQRRRAGDLVKERAQLVHERMGSPIISRQPIAINPSCSGQAHSNRPGPAYKNTDPRYILAVLRVPSIIRPLRSADCLVRQGCLIDSAQLAQGVSRS